MKRKLLCLFLIVAMAVCLLAGCAGGGDAESKDHEPYVPVETDLSKLTIGPYKWPVHKGIDYTKPYNKRFDGLTFTMAVGANGSDLPKGQTVESNIYTWAFEGITGLKPKVIWTAAGSAYNAKLNQAITAGEIPDLMFVGLNQYRSLVKAGLIADLTEELLENEHPTIQAINKARNNQAIDALKINGRIYGIPHVAASFDGAPLFWIRTDWLQKLGLSEPKSLKDLENIALAFMKRDPDGNGREDTYGVPAMASYGANYGGEGNLSHIFLNVGGAVPCTWQKQKNGKIIYGSLMDGAKEALTFLNGWYQKGILAEDFATWDLNTIAEVVGNNQAGIVPGPWFEGALSLHESITLNKDAQWKAFMLPKTEGDKIYASEGDALQGIYVVSKTFKYPEAFVYAYDMIESFGNEYNADAPDPTFTYSSMPQWDPIPGAYNPMYSPVPPDYYIKTVKLAYECAQSSGGVYNLKTVDEFKANLKNVKTDPVTLRRLDKVAEALAPVFAKKAGSNPRAVKVGESDAVATYQTYLLYWTGPEAIYLAKPIGKSTDFIGTTSSMEMYNTFLERFENESYTKMIMGHTDGKSISKYFDEFVKSYLKQGGATITDEINELLKNQ